MPIATTGRSFHCKPIPWNRFSSMLAISLTAAAIVVNLDSPASCQIPASQQVLAEQAETVQQLVVIPGVLIDQGVFRDPEKQPVRQIEFSGRTIDGLYISDDVLNTASRLSTVTHLIFSYDAYSSPLAFQHLANMPGLRQLIVNDAPFTDDMIHQICNNAPQLERLFLCGTNITTKSLDYIGGLSKLKSLDISGSHSLASGNYGSLVRLQHLRILRLAECDVRDEDITVIRQIRSLEHLDIPATKITNLSLATLAKMTHLRSLDLGDTAITREECDALHERLPRCSIHSDK